MNLAGHHVLSVMIHIYNHYIFIIIKFKLKLIDHYQALSSLVMSV